MQKGAIKAVVLTVIFFVAVGVFSMMTNHVNEDLTTEMKNATLPVITLESSEQEVNELYGYHTKMNAASMRDTITPIGKDRKLPVTIQTYETSVDAISYEIRSLDGERLIANADVNSYDEKKGTITAELEIQNLLQEGEEYLLLINLESGNDVIYYYTRIVEMPNAHVDESLKFVKEFHNTTFNSETSGTLSTYMEKTTGDNTTLQFVSLNSSLKQLAWADFNGEQLTTPVPSIKEITDTYNVIVLDYVVTSIGEGGESEYYNVEEYYRVRYTSSRMYLLNFERRMNQIFRGENASFFDNYIELGIRSGNVEYQANETGTTVAFVQEGELWSYNETENTLAKVFSFRGYEGIDNRENYGEHDIKIVRIDEAGSLDYIVYGYMNRGNHEGEVGAAVYYYRAERNVATEEIFVPADISYEMLKKQLDRLSYVNKQREMYLYLNENLCKVDIETGTTTVVRESIPEDCFVVSESQESIAWMDADNASSAMNITVMNLESGETQRFAADDGQKIRALGFINEDFVYGMANDSDILKDISGNEVFAMHTVRIVSIDGTVKKEYHQNGYYVTGVSISDGLLELDRVVRQENGYADAPEDHIMNGEQQSQELVTGRLATVDDRREQQFLLEFSTSGKTQSLLTLTPKYIYSTLRTDLTMSYDTGSADLYYVYGKGKLIAILSSPAEAVQLADENVGVVLNSSQSYVWERGNRQQGMRLDETTMPSGFQSASLDENVLKESLGDDYELLNLTGCTREEILYMISSGYGVVVKTGANESLLLTGYDIFGNSWLYNPATGETTALSDDDSDALFAQNGNVFISYIKKVKIE